MSKHLFNKHQRSFILTSLITIFVAPCFSLACHSKNDRRQNSNANERLAPCVRAMVQSSPVYICHMKLDLKSEIEDRLAKIFYNQCAVSLSDANAYTKMRFIANERYGLNITDPYLPDGSLNQAIDLMDCMRDFECEYVCFNCYTHASTFGFSHASVYLHW